MEHHYYCAKCSPNVHSRKVYVIQSNLAIPYMKKWVNQFDDEELLRPPQHFEVDDTSCQRYLRWIPAPEDKTAQVDRVGQVTFLKGRAFGMQCSAASGGVISCVMYDPVTGNHYRGRCGWNAQQGNIPALVWDEIPDDSNPDAYKFGKNCAEVQCVSKAYDARSVTQRQSGIEGCVFVAWDTLRKQHKPPCGSCKAWIAKLGARTA